MYIYIYHVFQLAFLFQSTGGNPPPLIMGPRSGLMHSGTSIQRNGLNHSGTSIQRNGSRISPNVSLTYTPGGGQSHSQVTVFNFCLNVKILMLKIFLIFDLEKV